MEASEKRIVQRVRIVNERGLHARAAAKFVKLAAEFESEIHLKRDHAHASGLSIMGLLTLAAGPGTELELIAHGEDAEVAVVSLAALIAIGFGEEVD